MMASIARSIIIYTACWAGGNPKCRLYWKILSYICQVSLCLRGRPFPWPIAVHPGSCLCGTLSG